MPRTVLLSPPNRCLVMGIVNVTPDSFSGDGLGLERDIVASGVTQAQDFCAAGADILDIGGESTRPGAAYVPAEQEIARVVPVIEAVRAALPDVAISIDTYKAGVAAAALKAGADILNDVWAMKADPDMVHVARLADCPVILMHNRSKPGHAEIDRVLGGSYVAPDYDSAFLDTVLAELAGLARDAIAGGVDPARIILDPGVGFGKTPAQNMALIEGLDLIRALGHPVLLGTSRKSFMGRVLNLSSDSRLEATMATTALGVQRGADIIRVHDVAENVKVVRMMEAMLQAGLAARAERHVP